MKKRNLQLLVALFIFIVLFKFFHMVATAGYKIGGRRGYSKNISESKKRGVFVDEVKYRFFPDSIKNENFEAFIEKGFRYGEKSAEQTDSLLSSDTFYYQLVFNSNRRGKSKYEIRFNNDSDIIRNFKFLKLETFSDTLCFEVVQFEENRRLGIVGVVKVWCAD